MKEEIKKYLMNNYDCDDFDEEDTRLIVQSEDIVFLVVEPHDNINNWLLRIAPRASFDRWGNSAAIEEFFINETELLNYLKSNQLHIYKELFLVLSNDHKFLKGYYDQ